MGMGSCLRQVAKVAGNHQMNRMKGQGSMLDAETSDNAILALG